MIKGKEILGRNIVAISNGQKVVAIVGTAFSSAFFPKEKPAYEKRFG